jgi:choline-sulfatase
MTVQSNLLFFMSDNHNRDVAGCYGHPLVKTPNIDRIAAAGVRFDNAYCASPLCCPSRAAVATGRFPHQTGYWDNALAYDGKIASWMHRLRDAGYDVVSVGKLHFRSGEDDNGFSEEILPMHILDGKGSVQTFLRAYDGEPACTTGKRWELYFKRSGVGSTHYQEYDQDITRNAIAWLERNAKKSGRPWALFVSYISPHPPFTVPKRLYDLYPLDQMPLPPGSARMSAPPIRQRNTIAGSWAPAR